MTLLQSAGKPISQQRATQIQSVFKTIAQLLLESNSATIESLKTLLDEMITAIGDDVTLTDIVASMPKYKSFAPVIANPEYSGKVTAGSFDNAFYIGWQETLEELLNCFKWKFSNSIDPDGHFYPTIQQPTKPTPEDYIAELNQALKLLLGQFPKSMDGELNPEEMMEPLEASTKSVSIKASAMTMPFVTLRANRKLQSGNRMLFNGILARIDEASEGIPAVGTGQPLFLPLATAEKIVSQVNASGSLPIDADPSLSKHNDQGIVGVITNALIKGQNLVVTGHLFPFNVPNMVRLLKDSSNKLGMSMNALVSGKTEVKAGREVFILEDVDLQGANVLFANKATYQQTRFTPMAAAKQPTAIPVAASTINNLPPKYMEENEILEGLQLQLKQMADLQSTTVAQLQASTIANQELSNRLALLEKERADNLAKEELQLAASAKAEQEKATQTFIQDQIRAGLREVLNTVNPRRAVSQFSATPLIPVSAESVTPVEIHPLKAEYDKYLLQAEALESTNATGSSRIGIINKLREIKLQAQMQGVTL